MSFTAAQQQAIAAEGNVLVEAGAGAGKTSTLVARCLKRVLDKNDPVSLDQILMVTFTEAAAAEMRKRIGEALERKSAEQPANERLAEQLALLNSAKICTLHSFCLQLVREHFYELELDPQLTVLDEAQSRLLAAETLDALLQRHYAGQTANAEAVQQLILKQARGWDGPIRDLVLRIHEYTQTRPDPAEWLARQLRAFDQYEASGWNGWLLQRLADWREDWLAALQTVPPENVNARQCLTALCGLPENPTRAQAAEVMTRILATDDNWPKGKKGEFRPPLKALFADAEFLQPLVESNDGCDPLLEDWNWVRPHMTTLLELAREFSQAFAATKRESGALDFHDLEQFTLRLLWDAKANRPTSIAYGWREKLRLVFVDEYQDINAAQDKIIQSLGREGGAANRFLVGDVKQSIYRFRLADPHIFQEYKTKWGATDAPGRVIPLADNFRSHETILNFVNSLFASLMRSVGGVDYDKAARLRFGAPEERSALSVTTDATPRVELLLRLTGKDESENEEGPGNDSERANDVADVSNAEMEARLVAVRLRELKEGSFQTWDSRLKKHRPIEWRDMVILLRSPRNKAESFAKEFARLGVPLGAARGGFFDTTEVSDLLSLLMLLDNPLQDVPALAVLRSPLVGLSLDELATIRLVLPGAPFWQALETFCYNASNSKSPRPDAALAKPTEQAWPKVDAFLKSFGAWRRLTRQGALSHCLETVLDETHYEDWLRAQSRGEAKRANVQRLLGMTRQFDQFQRQGLFRFMKYIEAQQKAGEDREPASAETDNAVRLMSIHKSKGLEFPVVVVAGLGGQFNFADLKRDILLDEEFGLCPHVHPPETEQRYPSLPLHWLAGKRQRREMLGEELRLLYVAMTRACDKLILIGTAARKRVEAEWQDESAAQLGTQQILSAKRYLDWIGPLLPHLTGNRNWLAEASGQSRLLNWRLVGDEYLASANKKMEGREDVVAPIDPAALESLRTRLSWRYPHPVAAEEPAKTSVSAIRRRMTEETDDEAQPLFRFQGKLQPAPATPDLSAAEIGTAHHTFLQFVSLDRADDEATLAREANRLEQEQVLTPEQRATLDLPALASFWKSAVGQKIRANARHTRRELSFTARFRLNELAGLDIAQGGAIAMDEFVVVQGVADLVVLLPAEIWLVDFKTDHLTGKELADKVKLYEPQMRLYAAALERIYRQPVKERWLHFLTLRKTVRCPQTT